MSGAAHYRAAREAFELAMKLGCTPRDAARELRRRQSACGRRTPAQPAPINEDDVAEMVATPTDFTAWNCQHMMRD